MPDDQLVGRNVMELGGGVETMDKDLERAEEKVWELESRVRQGVKNRQNERKRQCQAQIERNKFKLEELRDVVEELA